MPMHPAAPEDLAGLVDAYAQTVRSLVDLGITCNAKDFAKPTDCPGWTVQDQFSHIVSAEAGLLGRPDPVVEVPDLPHVRTDFARGVEIGVQLRRDRDGKSVIEELKRVTDARVARLRDESLTEETVVDSPMGPMELGPLMRMRVCDVWVHEQDVRTALGRPGNLDSAGAAVFTEYALQQLPSVVTDRARVRPGRVVMLELTGPVIARTGVRVETDEDGSVVGHLMFAGGTDETGPIPVIGKTTSIQMSTEAFTRRAAGRRSVDDLRYSVHGDEEVARRVLQELVLTP